MKKLLFLLFLLPLFISCDEIKEEDRYIETGPVTVARKVLLEEFTGQMCTNCPQAHAIIERLQEQYGEDLVVVSIHAMKNVFGIPRPIGLMEEEGDEYAARWGINALPEGVVDRNSGALEMDKWSTVIREDLEISTPVELDLAAQLSEDGSKIEIFTTIVSSEAMTGALQLWIVENNIVTFQLDGGTILGDYIHNNVFRGCVNGLWGENLPLDKGVVKYVSNEISVQEYWNLDNVDIVGFYYNDQGVKQVERTRLATKD